MPRRVDCDEITDLIRAGKQLDAEAQAHVQGCELCTALIGEGASVAEVLRQASSGLESDLETMAAALRQDLEREESTWFGKLRSLATPQRLTLVLMVMLALIVYVWLGPRRADIAEYPARRMLLVLTTLGIVGLGGLSLALESLSERPRPTPRLAYFLFGLALPTALAALPAAHVAHPASTQGLGADLMPRALACLLWGTAIALPVILLLRGLDRFEGGHSGRSALIAVVGGLFGNIALQLHCPLTGPAHLLLGHATVSGLVLIVYFTAVALTRRRGAVRS